MKIKYLSGPRIGQIDHAPNSQEMQLLAKAGIVQIVPYRDFRDRLREEGQGGADAHNVSPNFTKPGEVQWSVKDKDESGFRTVVIIKVSGSEKTYYSAPPTDAPKSVVDRFTSLTNAIPGPSAAAQLDAAKRAQAEQFEKEKNYRRW